MVPADPGAVLKVTFMSSEDEGLGALEIVQRNVYVLPEMPEKVDVGLDGEAIEPPVPLMMLHCPVPTVGVFAASVTEVSPQVDVPT